MMELLVRGQAVRLGPRIGKGGEGEVYKVEGLDCAAKVYTLKDDANREPKIAACTPCIPAVEPVPAR